jgi:hypothetical protein
MIESKFELITSSASTILNHLGWGIVYNISFLFFFLNTLSSRILSTILFKSNVIHTHLLFVVDVVLTISLCIFYKTRFEPKIDSQCQVNKKKKKKEKKKKKRRRSIVYSIFLYLKIKFCQQNCRTKYTQTLRSSPKRVEFYAPFVSM